VVLKQDSKQLQEVVFSALGIERQKREVGYSSATLSNDIITRAAAVNVANGLQGKVSGLNVTSVNNGVFEDVKINLRGIRSLTGNFTGLENTLITLDANSVTFKQVWANNTGVGGIDGLKLSVDPATNNVTCSSTANATLVNEPTYNNHYDPATKTFYISFLWGTFPNNRAATDTLTFNRPRE
jgi:hypothetical protein